MSILNRRFGPNLPPATGRYHLLVSATCPWCRRMLIVWEALGLDQHLSIAWATGNGDDGFTFEDKVTGIQSIRELYRRDPNYESGDPMTVPAIVDLSTDEIVCRDSQALMIDAVTAWRDFHKSPAPDLWPADQHDEVLAAWNWVDAHLSRFTHAAITGELAAKQAFESGLAELTTRVLGGFLVGTNATLADIAAFTPVQSWAWAGNRLPAELTPWIDSLSALSRTARMTRAD